MAQPCSVCPKIYHTIHRPPSIIYGSRLFAVKQTQKAVPANADQVHHENSVVKRHKLEVGKLDERPQHVVGLERGRIALLQLVLGAAALHDSHAAEEDTNHGWREEQLVKDLRVLVLQYDPALQNLEPGCCSRAKDR
jgi:hypothetical protein